MVICWKIKMIAGNSLGDGAGSCWRQAAAVFSPQREALSHLTVASDTFG